MRTGRSLCVLALAAGTCVACGGSVDASEVTRVAQGFVAAAHSGDGQRACRLLAPQAVSSVASGGSTCADEVSKLALRPGAVSAVRVWGDNAEVVSSSGVLFLSRFGDGWRVTAAGCSAEGDGRYDCELEA